MILPASMPVWGYVEDVSTWFRVPRSELFELISAGDVVSEKSGKRRRIRMASVDEYLTRKAEKEKREAGARRFEI